MPVANEAIEPATATNVKIIAMTNVCLYGHYGYGKTKNEAVANLRKAARKRVAMRDIKFMRFTSSLPFAPNDREAKVKEADAWVGRDGSVNWVRCDREHL